MRDITVRVDDAKGYEWVCNIVVDDECIRSGSYSPIAIDPEDFYGRYVTVLVDINWVEHDSLDVYNYYERGEIPQDLWDILEVYVGEL